MRTERKSRRISDAERVVRRTQILRIAARLGAATEAAASVRTIALLMPAASILATSRCRCPLCCSAA